MKNNNKKNYIYLEDVLVGLKEIKDNSIDIIIADPPYNIGKDFGQCKDDLSLDEYINWCSLWIKESLRVLKPNGTFYIYGFSEILAYIFVNSDCEFKRWLIWHYTNKNTPSLKYWQRSHESILILAKNKPLFNLDKVREPYTESFLKGSVGKVRTSTLGRFSNGKSTTIYKAHSLGALPRDVIKLPTLAGGSGVNERAYFCKNCNEFILGSKNKKLHNKNPELHEIINHPTQKPLALTKKLISAAKDDTINNNVLILFSGSGAEAVAAQSENCNVIGFEINPIYQKMGNDWLKLNK